MGHIDENLILGLNETITIEGIQFKAKIDTGADSSSIDMSVYELLGKKELHHKIKTIKSALGKHTRPTVLLNLDISDKKFHQRFTISDRKELKYKVLIGKDVLKKGNFFIFVNKGK
jgi:hypothetical protein